MVSIDLSLPRKRRPATLSPRRLRRERASSTNLLAILDQERPETRAQCRSGPRPCLWVSCRFHLYLDVNQATGSLKLNFPHLEPWQLPQSCALDLAEQGGLTLEAIGALLNLTRERARQLEQSGLAKLKQTL
ncbi:MAG: DNA-binding protein [Deltaproteobacteria bacterium]|nr:DNA-binding protein [Deltaproteobacteria bacterium]